MIDQGQFLRSLDYHLDARNVRPATAFQYKTATKRFFAWRGEAAEDITPGELERYFSHLKRRGLSAASVRWEYAGLKQSLKWWYERQERANPMDRLPAPRVAETAKDVVTPEDSKKIIASLDRSRRYRDAALIGLIVQTGMRASEVVALDWEDIDWRAHTLIIKKTKTLTPRTVALIPKTMERLDTWRERQLPIRECIFSGQRGRLTTSGLLQIVKKIFAEVGVPGIGPHDLRHSFATGYMDTNPDGAATAMAQGGWKSESMLRRYSRQGQEARALKAFRENNPFG